MDYSREEPILSNCKRLNIICENCSEDFWEKKSHYERKKRHFCSMKCYAEFRKTLPKEKQNAYKNGGLPEEEKKKRIKARRELNHAIRDKKIIKLACEACGNKNSQGHHHNYDEPLNVKWLCLRCHWEEHRLIYQNPELLEKK